MRSLLLSPLIFAVGCTSLGDLPARDAPLALSDTCGAEAACQFVNSPVRVDLSRERRLPSRTLPFYPTLEPVNFIDGSRFRWVAPTGTQTDGALIPPVFIPIVGQPTSPEFANAAAVHDAYCGIGNENGAAYQTAPWYQVHVMFYDALRAGGVPEIKAKTMFAAVWLGGPRWSRVRPLDTDASAMSFSAPGDLRVPVRFDPRHFDADTLRAALRRTLAFVEAENPDIAALIAFMTREERALLAALRARGADGGGAGAGQGVVGQNNATQDNAGQNTPGQAPGGQVTGGADPATGT